MTTATTSINAATITIIGPNGTARFAPQTFSTDAAQFANGTLAFPLTCDSSIIQDASSITVFVVDQEEPIRLTNVASAVDHFAVGQHHITGQIDAPAPSNNGQAVAAAAKEAAATKKKNK